ncbi:uncharacterized protein DUF5134 [Streptomyces sp. 2333.5]|uniref:DUF5134 domain-containing protein n=1 Tax=unclassified Streptomyces TaxID=2593676 RepID=UPI000897699D|nr:MULTISPECIES: DUF5134 domain-containing protein [unclassified Streptomyces]PJJ00685.1 uncharacterized protein DUF5134 [Streptomyces sp. 2333.5]SEC97125.1 protein of unknown function [Streptomyces sp. 2112.2]
MHGPPWVGWPLVLLCAAAGAYCLVRSRTGPAAERGAARGEGLMALGMAAMAWPAAAPPAWSPWLFTAVFGAAGLWALARRHLHHAVGAGAMAYMALAMELPPGQGGPAGNLDGMGRAAGMSAMGHPAPGGVPLLTGLLLVYFTVYVIGAGVRLAPTAVATVPDGPAADVGPTGVLRACRVAMGIGMLAMLLAL